MAYLMATTMVVNNGAAGAVSAYGVAYTTRTFFGEITSVVYIPSSSPFVANSSGMFILRRGSTTGDILCKSSSSLQAAGQSYFPAQHGMLTSGLATSNLTQHPQLAGDKICMIRMAATAAGAAPIALGAACKIIIKGANPYT